MSFIPDIISKIVLTLSKYNHELKNTVAQLGSEPRTFGLLVRCSSNWADKPMGVVLASTVGTAAN